MKATAHTCPCGAALGTPDASWCSICHEAHCSAKCANAHYYDMHGRPPARMKAVPHCGACYYPLEGEGIACSGCDRRFCRDACLALHAKRSHRSLPFDGMNGFDNEHYNEVRKGTR